MVPNPSPLKKVALVLLLLLALQLGQAIVGKRYWLNFTGSEPMGIYHAEKLDRPPRRGDMVIMSVPDRFKRYVYGRRWLPEGWPLLKHVGAVPGDLFCIRGGHLTINGAIIGPVFQSDHEGMPLPRLEGCRRVPAGHFLPVAAGLQSSFDGRYMGSVSQSEIRGLAKPVLTF